MVINTSGNVGIGTTSPISLLHLEGGNADIRMISSANYGGQIRGFNSASVGGLVFEEINNGTVTETLRTKSGNVGIGTTTPAQTFVVYGSGGAPASSGTGAVGVVRFTDSLSGISLDMGSPNSSPYPFIFQAHNPTNQATNYPLSFNPNGGNVGIGTTSPSSLLQVYGDTKSMGMDFPTATSYSYFAFKERNVEKSTIQQVGSNFATAGRRGDLELEATGDITLQVTDGNVGIGTTTPSKQFVVGTGDMQIGTNNKFLYGVNTLNVPKRLIGLDNSNNILIAADSENVVIGANGSAISIPVTSKFYLDGGSNTYITESSADNIQIATGGTTALTINSFQNLGIGTTSPTFKLDVAGSGYISSNLFVGGAITATSTLNVTGLATFVSASTTNIGSTGSAYFATSGGNVGVGTTTPDTTFSITSASDTFQRINSSNAGGDSRLIFSNYADGNQEYQMGRDDDGIFRLYRAAGTKFSLDTSDNFYFSGNVGIGTTTPAWLTQIAGTRPSLALSDTSSGTNTKHFLLSNNGGNLYIGTSTDAYATSTPAALTILNNGNVGVGTAVPGSKLDVFSGSGASAFQVSGTSTLSPSFTSSGGDMIVLLNAPATSYAAGIKYRSGGADRWQLGRGVGNGDENFNLYNHGTASTNLSVQYTSGNVGIGDISPDYLLDVAGTLGVDGQTTLTYASTTQIGSTGSAYFATSGGNVGIGTTAPGAALDIAYGGMTMVLGAETGAFTRTDATTKLARIAGYHYTNAEEPVGILNYAAGSADNDIYMGGGSGIMNAATSLYFNTAANPTTLNGTTRMSIKNTEMIVNDAGNDYDFRVESDNNTHALFVQGSDGNIGIGTTSPGALLNVVGASDQNNGLIKIQGTSGSGDYNGISFWARSGGSNAPARNWIIIPNGSADGTLDFRRSTTSTGNPTTETVTFDTNGNVGIGTTSPIAMLAVNGSVNFIALPTDAGTAYICTTLATGQLSTSTSACNGSSLRYKDNVTDLVSAEGFSAVLSMRPVAFTYKPELKVLGNQIGFIAEEMVNIVPEAVGLDSLGRPNNIDYSKMTPVLVKAIQEMNGVFDISGAIGSTTASLTVLSNGYIGVGTTTPEARFHVFSNINGGGVASFTDQNATCSIDPTNASLICSSDEKLKKDIVGVDSFVVLDKLMNIRAVQYHWNREGGAVALHTGFIAQEIEQVFPEFVSTDSRGGKAVAYSNFVPVIVEALKAVNNKVTEMDTRLTHLEELVASNALESVPNEGLYFAWVLTAFENIGTKFSDGLVSVKNILAEKLTVGSSTKPTGITLYDEVTGDPYCLKMQNGVMVSLVGECTIGETASTTPGGSGNATTTDTSLPVISIMGNNPAQITVGATYVDLGATVTDTNADGSVNDSLGLHFSVDGTEMNEISLDTSTTTTHTLVYSSVDGAGNWGFATRTVEVLEQQN